MSTENKLESWYQTQVEIGEDVVSRTIQGEEVILDMNEGLYFGLDEVGTQIWSGLKEKKTIPAICENLKEKFEENPDKIQEDLFQFLNSLRTRKLIRTL